MIVTALLQLGLAVLDLVLDLFGFLDPLSLGEGPDVTVPVPLLGSTGVTSLGVWVTTSVSVATALAVGKALQWLYSLVPYKGT